MSSWPGRPFAADPEGGKPRNRRQIDFGEKAQQFATLITALYYDLAQDKLIQISKQNERLDQKLGVVQSRVTRATRIVAVERYCYPSPNNRAHP